MVRDMGQKLWKKYKFAILVLVAGILLILLPTSSKDTAEKNAPTQTRDDFSLEDTERRMEDILSQIQGVGKLKLMLTLKSASQLELAEDADLSRESDGDFDSRRQPITVNRGSGYQDVVITGETYPVFQGALVVCEGADKSEVRLAVTEAVSALTGLGTDKISIVHWQS